MNTEDKKYCYDYPRPSVTSDSVIFGFDGNDLKILLIERGLEPYKGMWALPGGFMRMDESIEQCAARELREETNISNVYLEQFKVFSRPDRDPRGRVMTVAFIALVRPSDYHVAGGDDATRAAWFDIKMLPPTAFDHKEIIDKARERLKEILRVRPVAFKLLDEKFSVDELRKVYEAINGTNYDRRNFQRKLMQSDIVEEAPLPQHECLAPSPSATIINSNCECQMFDEDCKSAAMPKSTKRAKTFRLKSLFKNNADNNDRDQEEGSIKDLFNF